MKYTLTLFTFLAITLTVFAQKKKSIDDVKYQRNSLSTFLVSDGDYENKDKVLQSYKNYKFPDKYNDHRIDLNDIDLSSVVFNDEEMEVIYTDLGETKESFDQKTVVAKTFFGDNYKDERLTLYKIKKFLSSNKIGAKMVGKWYDNNNDGKFDLDLIEERGLFNASKEDIDKANAEERGQSRLIDGATLDLVPKTYLVLNKMSFISNEIAASFIRALAEVEISKLDGIKKDLATKLADKVYEKTSEGYSVLTTAYLFKLNWDESNSEEIYQNWESKDAFLSSANFDIEHVGTEKANSLVTFSLKAEDKDRTEDDIINLATVRNVEKVFSKLTKNYEDFKPKAPLVEFGKPMTAFVGMKEGLEGGETFEVLNEEFDSKTGRTIYKSVGKIKVDKKSIWDNRYSADDKPNDPNGPDRTAFKGKAKKATYGSLIRLIK